MRVDNSVLTGETEPISCTTVSTNENYMETKNLLFLGTTITEGNIIDFYQSNFKMIWSTSILGTGMGVVVATGGKTVMGFITTKTASSAASTSYMQKEINRFMILVCIVAGRLVNDALSVILWTHSYQYAVWVPLCCSCGQFGCARLTPTSWTSRKWSLLASVSSLVSCLMVSFKNAFRAFKLTFSG